MDAERRYYIAIDLKSFYASVECVERGLDPLDTHLVVADASRTEKTICLAVSPSLKALGISGRPRLFEVVQKVRALNYQRRAQLPHNLTHRSAVASLIKHHPEYAIDYIVASPQMALYLDYSSRIYKIYLKYFSEADINVYSIDEVFIDATTYVKNYNLKASELAEKVLSDILETTGITATAGIGTNLYLAKIAMDILAKHARPNHKGLRLAKLDEMHYRQYLWSYTPITDFWRVGPGYAKRLASVNIYTMGDVARCSLYNQALLYRLFGVNAELLIDHAWGYETTTIAAIKKIRPERKSLGEGQVLSCPYPYDKAHLVVREMASQLSLNLIEKHLVCQKLVLTVGFDRENLTNHHIASRYKGEIVSDRYGRAVPKSAHGTEALTQCGNTDSLIVETALKLFERLVNPLLLIRRLNLCAIELKDENTYTENPREGRQLDLFTDYEAELKKQELKAQALKRERKLQQAVLNLKHKYGKNAVFKASDLQEGATALQRNAQIGGHKA